jgi:signal transduction histidine kinase
MGLASGSVALALRLPVAALEPAPVVTNLLQFQRLVAAEQRDTCQVRLQGIVCWAARGGDQMVLQDAGGAALVETDPRGPSVRAGDLVRLEGRCTATGGGEGFAIGKTLVVDNDRDHAWQERAGDIFLQPGKHPLRVAWFIRTGTNGLSVSYEGPGLPRQAVPDSALSQGVRQGDAAAVSYLAGVRWRSYEGAWWQMPPFDRLSPSQQGTTANFNLEVRSRDELIALCFDGWLEVSRAGVYTFATASAGGSQLFIGSPQLTVVGTGASPVPRRIGLGQVLPPEQEGLWAEVEGKVGFVSPKQPGGVRLELSSGTGRIRVVLAAKPAVAPERLAGSRLRLRGLCWSAATLDEQRIPGVLWVPDGEHFEVLTVAPEREENPWEKDPLPLLTTAAAIKRLKREEATRGYPVKLRGVLTWANRTAVVLQDTTSGIFVDQVELNDSYHEREGEFWEVEGVTVAQFSPMILARRVTRLGRGTLPPPVQPAWDQLMNGSLDTLYVELQGIATEVETNRVILLTRGGKIQAYLPETSAEEAQRYEGALVRIRGCLWAVKDEVTHFYKPGQVQIHSAVIHVEEPPPAYPFATPLKRTAELLLFDPQAALLKQVKVAGQVVHSRAGEYFLMDGANGLRFVPRAAVRLAEGDLVEVVGFPELGGPSPLLREALARKTGHAPLPAARDLPEGPWPTGELDATRVRTKALLLNLGKDQQDQVLGLQAGPHVFVARLPVRSAAGLSFPVGSRLELTGTFAGRAGDRAAKGESDSFELLLNSPEDIRLLARPAWYTLRRMMLIVGVLVGGLLMAMIWITVLRKQVEQRSAQLRSEIQERERTEQLRALEEERSRIARDLHDDLGSSLTEISLLADAGPGRPPSLERAVSRFQAIGNKARSLVQALDVIVWLVNPSKDLLPFLAGYLGSYAEDYLSASDIGCRLKIPLDMPPVRLNANVRHNLFLAVKEVLHNTVRHAHASEVLVEFALRDGGLETVLSDNGRGFDPSAPAEGNGLANLRQRLASVGGRSEICTQPGAGASIRLFLPLPAEAGHP